MSKCCSLLSLLFIFSACTAQIPQSHEIEEFSLRALAKYDYLSSPSLVDYKSKKTLLFYEDAKKQLHFLDWEKDSIIEQIDFFAFTHEFVSKIHYHNEDSIFLSINAARHRKYWHDSSLFLMNSKGEKLRAISFRGLPVWHSANPDMKKKDVYYVPPLYSNIFYKNSEIHLALSRYSSFPGEAYFEEKKSGVLAYIDIGHDALWHCDTGYVFPMYYPVPSILKENPGFSFVRSRETPRFAIDKQGNPLVLFSHSRNLYYYDREKEELETWKIESALLDSIALVLYPDALSAPQFDFREGELIELNYNEEGDYFLLFYRLPSEFQDMDFFQARYQAIAFRKGGEIFSEFLLPQGVVPGQHFFDGKDLVLLNISKNKQQKDACYFYRIKYKNL